LDPALENVLRVRRVAHAGVDHGAVIQHADAEATPNDGRAPS
jgi:hypothetical protein